MNSKKQKRLIITLLCLLLLCGIYIGVQKYNEKEAEKTTAEEAGEEVATIDADKVTEFSFTYSGTTLTFKKSEDTWVCQESPESVLDSSAVETLLSNVSSVTVDRTVESTDENFADYGLDEPSQVLTFTTADGTTTINVGDLNSVTSTYYMSLNKDKVVYMVASDMPSAFQITLDSLLSADATGNATDTTSGDATAE